MKKKIDILLNDNQCLTNILELLHETDLYYLMLVLKHFDSVEQDYVIVQLIDFSLLQFVQFVVPKT